MTRLIYSLPPGDSGEYIKSFNNLATSSKLSAKSMYLLLRLPYGNYIVTHLYQVLASKCLVFKIAGRVLGVFLADVFAEMLDLITFDCK